MTKKIILGLLVLVLLVIIVEVVALLRLKASLASYANYWKHTSTSGSFTYVALGDSAAQGIGASSPEKGYVGLIAQRIEKQIGKKVRIVNLSVSGAKIEDVINKQLPQLKNYNPDLVTMEIGANDVAQKYNSDSFAVRYEKLASQLPKGTVVGNMPYFGGRIKHNSQALDANKHIQASARKHDLRLVDLQTITRERNSLRTYASDYFHPSNTGYQNWAEAYWQVIAPILTK